MNLAAVCSSLPAHPETLHLATSQGAHVKISTKSVANLILNSPATLLNPCTLWAALVPVSEAWLVKWEYLCPGSRELGTGFCAG